MCTCVNISGFEVFSAPVCCLCFFFLSRFVATFVMMVERKVFNFCSVKMVIPQAVRSLFIVAFSPKSYLAGVAVLPFEHPPTASHVCSPLEK